MRTLLALLCAAAVIGAVLIGVPRPSAAPTAGAIDAPTPAASRSPGPAPRSSSSLRATPIPAAPAPPPEPDPTPAAPAQPAPVSAAVVVRSIGALPDGLPARLAALDGVEAAAVVASGPALLRGSTAAGGASVDAPPQGWGIPLEVAAVEPGAYAALLDGADAEAFRGLAPGRALLGATSARLRGLGPGATLHLDGASLVVAGVVADEAIGAAEVVVANDEAAALGLPGIRYVVLRTAPGGDDAALATGARSAIDGVPQVLVRELGRAPWSASWREVLPQAVVKDRFGEFAVRPGGGRSMEQEAGWAEAHLATASVPILGEVRCHRSVLGPLAAALGELEAAGLAGLVDPGDYAGCFSPRLIGAGAGPSRHAWGLAVDLNASRNPFGAPSAQDPRLVEVMRRHGFGFGGDWPIPDAMHFEYRGT